MQPTRRSFLETSAGVVAAPSALALGANETIDVGLIGVGGRCRALVKSLKSIPNVRITAVCDIYDGNLETARSLAEPGAFATKDHRALLDRKDVDAVLIAAPDHWHVPMTVAACDAGKDVYVEKPLTHRIEEGRAVIDAKNRGRRVVQVGTQQRSMPHFQKAAELVKAGRLGKIHKVHLTWNRNQDRVSRPPSRIRPEQVDWKAFLGNAPDQPFDPYRLLGNWRWFWDFGGGLFTDLMVHYIDVVHWFLDLDHPAHAVAIGDWFTAKGVWETPDTVQTLLSYPDAALQVYYEGTFSNARNGAMLEFMGTDATLYLDRGRYEIHPERGRGAVEEWILGTGKRGADFYDKPDGERLHLENWLECVRSRAVPNSPVEAGVSAAAAAHLANRALRSGGSSKWDS
ncbi:MAG: Gfo/Idh/MocA family oxidoreductase [Isosphaeraceae bacterium]|nr:Gfo/Idh/MocA family oxidoreductase [Isosphaeraceae bacterium]